MTDNLPHTSDRMREVLGSYRAVRQLDDGRWIGLLELMYHYTIHVGIDEIGYQDRWCIATLAMAEDAFRDFDGVGEPKWWHKHPSTGRYRDLETGAAWTASQMAPEGVAEAGWPFNFEMPGTLASAARGG